MESAAPALSAIAPSRIHARLLLGAFVLAAGFFVAVTLSPLAQGICRRGSRTGRPGSVQRRSGSHARGQSYYDAAAAELTERGYQTRSVFNWRTPLPVWLIGVLPDTVAAAAVLVAIGLVLVALSFGLLADEGGSAEAVAGRGCCCWGAVAVLSGQAGVERRVVVRRAAGAVGRELRAGASHGGNRRGHRVAYLSGIGRAVLRAVRGHCRRASAAGASSPGGESAWPATPCSMPFTCRKFCRASRPTRSLMPTVGFVLAGRGF